MILTVIIEDSGHGVFKDVPTAFGDTIKNYLAS